MEKADTQVPFILERRPPAENTVTTILDEGRQAQAEGSTKHGSF